MNISRDSYFVNAESGLVDCARVVTSPNQDDRPDDAVVDVLVIHAISLPPACYGGEHIEALFCNQLDHSAHPYFEEISGLRVSAHFLIRRNGELIQFVPVHKRAWHAGQSSFHEREAANDYAIGIELEGCDEDAFESVQYEVLIGLCQGLMHRYPQIRRDHIVGHSDISPGRKTDPGPCFDWKGFLDRIG